MERPRERLKRRDVVNDWNTIAKIIGDKEGWLLTRQAMIATHNRLLKKLKYLLLQDPDIKDWVIEHGLDVD